MDNAILFVKSHLFSGYSKEIENEGKSTLINLWVKPLPVYDEDKICSDI